MRCWTVAVSGEWKMKYRSWWMGWWKKVNVGEVVGSRLATEEGGMLERERVSVRVSVGMSMHCERQ
tara:strand:- start:29534 stop:29731 length:198 start_codon:yes stop_codon:yes gene_type:complete